MYKHKQQTPSAFRFKRFCRAKWAAYSSMHREVTIGRVATRVADSSLRKSAAAVALGLVMAQGTLMAQSDLDRETRTLPEVQVAVASDSLFGSPEPVAVLTAADLKQSSVRTVGDILAMLPGIDVRSRGVGDVQGDLAMRGGTFDQMVVLLGGINITDAQTGHHNLDMPIDIAMVERVELLTPAQLLARGVVAFCGAVNIVVNEQYRDHLLATLAAGSYGTVDVALLGTKAVGHWALTAAGAYHRSDGYRPNTDYGHGSLLLQATTHRTADDWQLQLGAQSKAFGSAGFYSTTYPDQYEATRTLVASAYNVHRFGDRLRSETALYGRLHGDRFELFRTGYVDAPAWYTGHNHHLGSTAGLRSRLVASLASGEALVGVELKRDGIRSNVLGTPDTTLGAPFDKSASRFSTSLFAGYSLSCGHWSGDAEVLGTYNTFFGFDYAAAASVKYRVAPFTVHLSLSRSYRLPSFTDLYYHSVTQLSNPDLDAEHSLGAELGTTLRLPHVNLQLSAYYRAGTDIIDWVRSADTELWRAVNHTAVNAAGLDAAAVLHLAPFDLRLAYSYCHIDKSAGDLLSQYALEHLRHKAEADVALALTERLRLKLNAAYRLRQGSYIDSDGRQQPYGDVFLFGTAAEYSYRMFTFSLEGYNLGDTAYRDHGGVPMPGRTIMARMRVEL